MYLFIYLGVSEEHAASTSRVTELVGWISKSPAFSQTNFVTLKPGGSNFFRNVGRLEHYMVQNPTEGHYLICHFSIPFLNFSSCLKITTYETHSFRITNEVLPYNLSVRLEAGKEVCKEILPLRLNGEKNKFLQDFLTRPSSCSKALFAFA